MSFKTTREVTYNGKTIAAGKPIVFTDDDAGVIACDQLLGLDPPAIVATDDKPLERMTKAELMLVVAEEEVEVADGANNQAIADAIKAKRGVAS